MVCRLVTHLSLELKTPHEVVANVLTSEHLDASMRNMNTVRTTITLPEDMHRQLMLMAMNKKMSFNDVVKKKLMSREVSEDELEEQIEKDLAELRRIGRKIKRKVGNVDVARIIREERDRDNA